RRVFECELVSQPGGRAEKNRSVARRKQRRAAAQQSGLPHAQRVFAETLKSSVMTACEERGRSRFTQDRGLALLEPINPSGLKTTRMVYSPECIPLGQAF